MALAALPEALATESPEEVLLERLVEEAVQGRVDACVAVAEQVQEGGEDAHARRVFVKEQVHLQEGIVCLHSKWPIQAPGYLD